jgi:ABC-type Fe3+ transport system permease subunit
MSAATDRRVWGVLAEFATVEELLAAAEGVRDAGYRRFDAHSPIPVHGIDEAMGIRAARVPLFALGGGITGCAAGLALQWFTNAFDYPLKVSGKPLFALPPAIPVVFELTILLGALGAVVAMLVGNGLPQLYHPLFGSARFRRATTDRFFLSIEASDPRFEPVRTRELLASLGSLHVEEVEE